MALLLADLVGAESEKTIPTGLAATRVGDWEILSTTPADYSLRGRLLGG